MATRTPPPSILRMRINEYFLRTAVINKNLHVDVDTNNMHEMQQTYYQLMEKDTQAISLANCTDAFTVDISGIGEDPASIPNTAAGSPILTSSPLLSPAMQTHTIINTTTINPADPPPHSDTKEGGVGGLAPHGGGGGEAPHRQRRNDFMVFVFKQGSEDLVGSKTLLVLIHRLVDFVHNCFSSDGPIYKTARTKITSHLQLPAFMADCMFACDRDIVIPKFYKLKLDPFLCILHPNNNPRNERTINRATMYIINNIALDIPLSRWTAISSAGYSSRGAAVHEEISVDYARSLLVRILSCIPHFQMICKQGSGDLREILLCTADEVLTYAHMSKCLQYQRARNTGGGRSNDDAALTATLEKMYESRDVVTCVQLLAQRFLDSNNYIATHVFPITTTTPALCRVFETVSDRSLTYRVFCTLLRELKTPAEMRALIAEYATMAVFAADRTLVNENAPPSSSNNLQEQWFNSTYVLMRFENTHLMTLTLDYLFWNRHHAHLIGANSTCMQTPFVKFTRNLAAKHISIGLHNNSARIFALNKSGAKTSSSASAFGSAFAKAEDKDVCTDSSVYACLPASFVEEVCYKGAALYALVAYPPDPAHGHQLLLYATLSRMILNGDLQTVRWAIAVLCVWMFHSSFDLPDLAHHCVTQESLSYIQTAVPRMIGILMSPQVDGCDCVIKDIHKLSSVFAALVFFATTVEFLSDPPFEIDTITARGARGSDVAFYPTIAMKICQAIAAGQLERSAGLDFLSNVLLNGGQMMRANPIRSMRTIGMVVMRRSLSAAAADIFKRAYLHDQTAPSSSSSSSYSAECPEDLLLPVTTDTEKFSVFIAALESATYGIVPHCFDVHRGCFGGVPPPSPPAVYYRHNDPDPYVHLNEFMHFPTAQPMHGIRASIWSDVVNSPIGSPQDAFLI